VERRLIDDESGRDPAGEELVAFLKEHSDFERVIYVGDGGNDFCPLLRLKKCVLLVLLPRTLKERSRTFSFSLRR
jgi:predicted mannosyl-3-phosphoglycerate phosphatase (HAD superfamily)